MDVGFGPRGPTQPLPLEDNKLLTSIALTEMRLIKDSILEFTDKTQKVWIYQIRYASSNDWLPVYCFAEVELLPQDFEVMNFWKSQNRTSPFTQKVICARMLLDVNEEDIEGQIILNGNIVKERIRGEEEILQILQTENDRVDALASQFGLHFQEDEVQGIHGLVSQIA
jgi:arylamine N-acetyltransferase